MAAFFSRLSAYVMRQLAFEVVTSFLKHDFLLFLLCCVKTKMKLILTGNNKSGTDKSVGALPDANLLFLLNHTAPQSSGCGISSIRPAAARLSPEFTSIVLMPAHSVNCPIGMKHYQQEIARQNLLTFLNSSQGLQSCESGTTQGLAYNITSCFIENIFDDKKTGSLRNSLQDSMLAVLHTALPTELSTDIVGNTKIGFRSEELQHKRCPTNILPLAVFL